MTKKPIRYWFWKILRLTIAAFLIAGFVDILMVAANHAVGLITPHAGSFLNVPASRYAIPPPIELQPYNPYDSLDNNPSVGAKAIVKAQLKLRATPEEISARYEIYLPKDHPLFKIVQSEAGAKDADKLVKDVLGNVLVKGNPLKFYPAETAVAENDDNAHFYVNSYLVKPTDSDYAVIIESPAKRLNLQIQKREITVGTQRAQVWSDTLYNVPLSKDSDLTIFALSPSQSFFYFYIHFPEWAGVAPEPTPASTPKPILATLLAKQVPLPGLGWALYSVLDALPFLVFIFWARKYKFEEEQPGFRQKLEAIKIYLVFHFGYYFFYALDNLVYYWRNPALLALSKFQEHTIAIFNLSSLGEHYYILPLMVLFLFVWPAKIVRWERHTEGAVRYERLRKLTSGTLMTLVLVGLVLWTILGALRLKYHTGPLSIGDFYLSLFGFVLLALFLACIWLTVEVFENRRPTAALLILILLAVLMAIHTFITYTSSTQLYGRIASSITVAVFVLAATVLVASFARLMYRVFSGHSYRQAWKNWNRPRRLGILIVIIAVAVSTRSWKLPMEYWPLWSLAWELKDLFLLALVWILIDFLRYKSRDTHWLQLPESTRQAGVLLALTLFYSSTSNWHYIPVSFIVGFVLLDKWLLSKKRFDRRLFSEIRGQLPTIIQKIIDLNDAERSLRSLKKELLSKVGKGELTYKQYLQKLRAQNKAVENLQKDSTIQGHPAKDIVLSFGPTDSAWENGQKAALYSLLFSAPWTILYLRNVVRAEASAESYLILDTLGALIFFLLSWTSFGFIFGYFYPYIKGNNGIHKGLSLFLTIVIPELVATSLSMPVDRANWYYFGFWGLQIFVHTMLLGLIAGDFETLRRAGFKMIHLLEIHKFSALSAWASSIIIAIGAAVSALISTGATQMIASVLKFSGVLPGGVDIKK